MTFGESIVLGAVQGITEFLPISSSGHLVFAEEILELPVASLKSFDVMVHMGTLGAILIYFWHDVKKLFYALLATFNLQKKSEQTDEYQGLLGAIIIGTVPAVIVGLTAEECIDRLFRHPGMVALVMFIIGIVYFLAEQYPEEKSATRIRWWRAIVIGIAQAIALIPGVSRSGSTISAGLFTGIKREKAARFSFLLGIPAILGAGILTAIKSNFSAVGALYLVGGFISALLFGLASVSFLMYFLKKHTLYGFGVYLMLIGLFFFILR